MSEIIKVGMADWKVCSGQDGVTTLGLGSCVGIAIRDPATVPRSETTQTDLSLPIPELPIW